MIKRTKQREREWVIKLKRVYVENSIFVIAWTPRLDEARGFKAKWHAQQYLQNKSYAWGFYHGIPEDLKIVRREDCRRKTKR